MLVIFPGHFFPVSKFTWITKSWSAVARWAQNRTKTLKIIHQIRWVGNQGASPSSSLLFQRHISFWTWAVLPHKVLCQCQESGAPLAAPPWETSREGAKVRSQENREPCVMWEKAPSRLEGGILEEFLSQGPVFAIGFKVCLWCVHPGSSYRSCWAGDLISRTPREPYGPPFLLVGTYLEFRQWSQSWTTSVLGRSGSQ